MKFSKNALNTLTKLILSHLAEVLGCLASACSRKQNRFPEQYVARKPSKLIYLVLWGDTEHPPVSGMEGSGGKGGGGRAERADGKLPLLTEKEHSLTVFKTIFPDEIDFVLGTVLLSLKCVLLEKE